MIATVFCSTHNISLDGNFQRYVGEYLLRNNMSANDLLAESNEASTWAVSGLGFLGNLSNKPHFMAKKENDDFNVLADSVRSDVNNLENFIFSFWFVKDCGCSVAQTAIMVDIDTGYGFSSSGIFSDSKGQNADMYFSIDDIDRSYTYYKLISEVSLNNPNQVLPDYISNSNPYPLLNQPYNQNNRIMRAMTFLHLARSTPFLPQKISFYVLILECLFSANDSTEIQHKLGERIALYIGRSLEERQTIYADFKEYYKVRSAFFHGQEMNKKYNLPENLKILSSKIDSLVRSIFIKVLENDKEIFLLDQDLQREYFNKLVLGNN